MNKEHPPLGFMVFCVTIALVAYLVLLVAFGENPLNWLVRQIDELRK